MRRNLPFTGAHALVRALEHVGVELIFGYPGGAIMPVYDALAGSSLRHILVRHEQAAALAADGYARATGKVGVCMATSGPGATNLITGIANAYMDSVPMVVITGQVPTTLIGTDAFQEFDIVRATLPYVKHSWLVRDASSITDIVRQAFEVAAGGRPGPVLIDLPKDVTAAEIDEVSQPARPQRSQPTSIEKGIQAEARELLSRARKPLLYLGGGVRIAGAVEAVRQFASTSGIPAVATLQGLGVLSPDNPLFLGMLGMHGSKAANRAVQECDLLICCGARFDDRATGRLDGFAPHADVIHLDIDPAEIGKLRPAVALVGQLPELVEVFSSSQRPQIEGWRKKCRLAKSGDAFDYEPPHEGVFAPRLLRKLSIAAGPGFTAACDVGQHQMWVAQHCIFSHPSAQLTSGGLGTMGYGLPAGIGAKLARPDRQVVTITGDGSFMMNLQELATVKRYDIALKVLLLDNSCLGMVRQWQELFYDQNYSEIDLSDNPDFVAVAQSFGIPAFSIDHRDEEEPGIARLLAEPGPCLAHVKIDPAANVWPLVPQGKSNSTMLEGQAA